jgi:hypothetical protein
MKKLFVLLFSLLISFNSYGEWTKITTDTEGNVLFIEFDTIKEWDGYVYFWHMHDYLKPKTGGMMSTKMYIQVDCGVLRYKPLLFVSYQQSMGKGESSTHTPPEKWHYAVTGKTIMRELNEVCEYIN